ncbi:MAG TPA: glycosyltransferase [Terriglobales bacterium]|nr:glycosyltransferase [Terriglobales bacterium]
MTASVLYLTTSGQVGGAERCLLSLAASLDRARFSPEVLVGSPGPLLALLAADAIPAELVPLPPALRRLSRSHPNPGLAAKLAPLWQAPLYLRRLARAGARRHPALIHSNGVKMHYCSALLRRHWNAPLLWHLHDFPAGADAAREPLSSRLLRRLSRQVTLAIANSAAVAQAHAARYPRLAPRLRVVPNGVNLEQLQGGDGAALRARWQLPPQALVIGMVAIFAPWKGQEIFLRAARRVLEHAPATRFVLVGDDIYDTTGHGGRRQELEALARELGLGEAVRFPGFVGDEIASAYAALDVMVHASTAPEPFGRTVIEAMAAGVPVIAAAAGGMLEVVEDGVSGLLTPPGDEAALAQAMLALAADPARRRQLAANGLRRVRERFSEAVVGRQIEAVYAEALEHP